MTYVNNYGWNNSACLIPINPDHDNHIDVLGFNHAYEITFRYWNGVELVDRPGWPKNFYPFLPTPPVVGDVDGDGQEEIIIGTYNPTLTPSAGNLLIYALDGTLKQTIPVVGGIKHIPALADVEGIGRLDVVYRSTLGQVYVQNFGATGTNNVSWATHRGNMHRDGNRGVSLFPPGTPLVTKKPSGYNRVSFSWTNASSAQCFRIYRAEQASGPFQHIATVTAATTAYTDYGLKPGWQYFYEVGAVYSTNTVHSSPIAVLPLLNSNLVANAGFEENDNSHWDKWYSGTIGMTNMVASTNTAYQGKQSMRIILENQGDNGSISQFNQYGIPDSTLLRHAGRLLQLRRLSSRAPASPSPPSIFSNGSRPKPATTPTTVPQRLTRTISPRISSPAPARPTGLTRIAPFNCPPVFPMSNSPTITPSERTGQWLHLP